MLKTPAEYDRDNSQLNQHAFLAKFLHDSLLGMSAGICNRAAVDKLRMIRTQMETYSKS
jgi:hypothetical protein